MSDNNGNGKPPLTYEQATAGLKFTKDFNDSLDAIMNDRLAAAGARIMAWLKRTSWGRFSLFCKDDNGKELFQQDCARELGIDKRLVSKTMQYFEMRGYLERRGTAKVLYPVLSPVLSGPDSSIVNKSPAWRLFMEGWKVANAATFLEYEVACATVERIRKVLHADYRQSQRQATKSADLNKEEILEGEEEIEEENAPPPQVLALTVSAGANGNGESGAVVEPGAISAPDSKTVERFEAWRAIRNECVKPVPDDNLELRRQCFDIFASYSPPEQERIIYDSAARIPIWANDKPQFVPAALKYLKSQLWRTDPVQHPTLLAAAKQDREFQERVARLDAWRDRNGLR